MKRTVILLFGCIFALGIFSCKTSIEESPADDEDVYILVNDSEVTASLEAGRQYILRLSNGVSAAWAVDDASVAALSAASGVSVNLTAQAAGSVTVAATANGTAYTCALQITESGGGQNGGGSNAPNVSFINLSAYKVVVCRDGLGAEIATVEAGGTKSVYVSPGRNEITFHFRYSYCIIADDDSGMVWLDVADNGAYTYPVDSADVAAGAVQIRIPSPKNPQFGAAYLKVENQWNAPISLYNGNTQQKLYNREKYYIQPGHSGVYSIQPDAQFEGFKLGASPASATAVAPFYAESGGVYKCEFDGSGTAAVATESVRQRELYTVNHYQQNTDCQTYTLIRTELLTGTLDAPTAAKADVYEGFAASPFEQKPIAGNRTTVIEIYYDRNAYTVVFSSNNETGDTATQVFYYGVPQKLNKNTFSYSDYMFGGWGWSETDDIVYADQAEFCGEYTSDVTLYAKWFHGITATADTVGKMYLTGITGEYIIKVIGDISQGTLTTLAGKMKNKTNLRINLDLSEAVLETIPSSSSFGIFYACPLYSIVLPETLKTIGENAFCWCDNLKSVEITGVETIGESAFSYCGNLKTVVLKDIGSVGVRAFARCRSLSSVAIDAETIGYWAFEDCTSLTSVIIGKNVRSIGSSSSMPCFAGCTALTSVQFEDTENWYDSSGLLLDVTDAAENARRLKDDSAKPWVKK